MSLIVLLNQYKRGKKELMDMITELGTSEQDELDKKMLNSMVRDMSFVIDWIEQGKNPDEMRGIDIRKNYHIKRLSNMDVLPDLVEQIEREPLHLTDEQKRIVLRVIESLSDRERDCFILYASQGLSMSEVGEQLGIKKTTVQNYIDKAKNKINNIVSEGTERVRISHN